MKNPKMLKFVPDNLKAKTMCKHVVKNLPFVMWYIHDQYKSKQMCAKAILEDGRTLHSVPYCYKNKKMYDKAVDDYPHALNFPIIAIWIKKFMTKLSILILL